MEINHIFFLLNINIRLCMSQWSGSDKASQAKACIDMQLGMRHFMHATIQCVAVCE